MASLDLHMTSVRELHRSGEHTMSMRELHRSELRELHTMSLRVLHTMSLQELHRSESLRELHMRRMSRLELLHNCHRDYMLSQGLHMSS